MQMHSLPRIRCAMRTATLLTVLGVAACAPTPDERERHPQEERAEAALEAGDRGAAVSALLAAADAQEGPVAQRLRLRAAAVLLEDGESDRATEIVEGVAIDDETPKDVREQRGAVLARLAIARGAYQDALDLTDDELPAESPRGADLLEARALAQLRLGRPFDSAQTLSAVDPLLDDADRRNRNHQRIRDALAEVPLARLTEEMPPTPDAFGGWTELAYLVRTHRLEPDRMEREIAAWERRYPEHPARGAIAEDLMRHYREEILRPERVTVLLPLSGPLAESGRAVRNGLLAARLGDRANGPALRFRDIGDDGEAPWSAYLEAVRDGADLVIGPLDRESVRRFARERALPVPVLALNSAGDDHEPPENLFRFGLLPEHEARQAARHAATSGQRRAVALVPDDDWGERVGNAFEAAYAPEGGTLLALERYAPDDSDFSSPIRRVLALDESEAREQRLRQTLGRSLDFEPRRRQDIDVVFIGAFPRQARLIRPQLRFHRALDLPVMSTSHAWRGRRDVAADDDMAGVVIFDMPWMLGQGELLEPRRSTLEEAWGDDLEGQAPLYALGLDAYRLIPHLGTLRARDGERVEGATGLLHMGPDGEIHRELQAARFQNGRVERLGTDRGERLPALDEAGDE